VTVTVIPFVVLAGGVGALLRFLVTQAIPTTTARPFPIGVVTVNVLGSLVAGMTLGLLSGQIISVDVAIVIWAGLCGGLTTFSTVAVETIMLGRHHVRLAWLNIAATVVGGCASAAIGFAVTRLLFP